MNWDRTQTQSNDDRERARDLSHPQRQPPASISGIELLQFLGDGAFGEVWIGLDNNTGRQVAVKFFANRRGLDWAGMAGEVEKLVLLSNDRRIVQLLQVGWDADPPYFVMEYLEQGSLESKIAEHGPLSLTEAVALFAELAQVLRHAHAKGVLHCDLKPANVLLDHDQRPRLCDFGQSRLTQERKPALGTFFYMAPEQASLEATPDVRWDVYGLGAILHTCLTGKTPFSDDQAHEMLRSGENLSDRLARYRKWIDSKGELQLNRSKYGIDRRLATILERCLARKPERRFANIQEVIDAVEQRAIEQQRRPFWILGGVAPLLLVVIMAFFTWRGMHGAVDSAQSALLHKVFKSNEFAAQFVASRVTGELDRYFREVEQQAEDSEFLSDVQAAVSSLNEIRLAGGVDGNADPQSDPPPAWVNQYRQDTDRLVLEKRLQVLLENPKLPQVASWFVCGPDGTFIASAFDRKTPPTLGRNFAWRTYFHGNYVDLPQNSVPPFRLSQTQLSALLKSTATQTWKIAVSTPLRHPDSELFNGVVVVTFEVGRFLSFFEQGNAEESRFAVLVDKRAGPNNGMILQHPLFTKIIQQQKKLPDHFTQYRVKSSSSDPSTKSVYRDPLGKDANGRAFDKPWIAADASVMLPNTDKQKATSSGLVVIVQEDQVTAVAPVFQLEQDMRREVLFALLLICVTVLMAWYLVLRRLMTGADRKITTIVQHDHSSTPA